MNLLGKREVEIYGNRSFEDYFHALEIKHSTLKLEYYQSNHEGFIIDKLQQVGYDYDGIVINPAGYSHTSIAIMDCIKAISTPVVEVHISDILEREAFRHHSYTSLAAIHTITGQGLKGYDEAILYLIGLED